MMYFQGGNELSMTENPDYTEVEKIQSTNPYVDAFKYKKEAFYRKLEEMKKSGRAVEMHITTGDRQIYRIMEKTGSVYEELAKSTRQRLRAVREYLMGKDLTEFEGLSLEEIEKNIRIST